MLLSSHKDQAKTGKGAEYEKKVLVDNHFNIFTKVGKLMYIYDTQSSGSQDRHKEQQITLRPSQYYYYSPTTQGISGLGYILGEAAPLTGGRFLKNRNRYIKISQSC